MSLAPSSSPSTARLHHWHPRHWPSQLGLILIRAAARLPWRILMPLTQLLRPLISIALRGRMRYAERNLQLCFPEWDESKRAQILKLHQRDLAYMLGEFALGWMANHRNIDAIPHHIDGLEHLQAAHARGQGVLLVGGHFSHLELAGRLLTRRVPLAGMYRVHGDAAFEDAIRHARLQYASAMFKRDELRAIVKHLKAGGLLWYAPDQGMRGKDARFVPFFGIPASTITATHHLARLSGACVVPFFHRRLADGRGYALRLEAPLENFPSSDVDADSARVNAVIEAMVREAPEQYLWIHKRFKTRPEGQPSLYEGIAP